jgi:hypothetical protein
MPIERRNLTNEKMLHTAFTYVNGTKLYMAQNFSELSYGRNGMRYMSLYQQDRKQILKEMPLYNV